MTRNDQHIQSSTSLVPVSTFRQVPNTIVVISKTIYGLMVI